MRVNFIGSSHIYYHKSKLSFTDNYPNTQGIEKVIKLWYNRKQKFMKNERRKYMNNSKQDILNNLIKEPFINQRILAAQTGHSLGIVNRSIKELISEGYLDEEIRPTEKTLREAKEKAPKNAIILAAGFGMRMVPINTETPKGLLEIKGERLIERTIRQLHEVGITEIYVVVGFMKEQYEYLIDEYGVELIVAPDYASKNNLHSLKTAAAHLSNSYIIPCDIWCEKNPYSRNELYSWYMVSDLVDDDSTVRVNRKQELVVQKEAGRRKRDDRHLLSAGNRKRRSCGSVWKNWEEIPDTTERSGRKPYTGKTE